MNVLVVGAGKVGYYLTKALLEHGHRVSVVEKSPERCARLAEAFEVLTICGDATVVASLADAGADRADVLVATTGLDEVNLVACQLAQRRFGVRRTVARVNNPKNRGLFRRLGVDLTVSSTGLIADLIEREIASQHLRTLLTFHYGELTLVEVSLPAGAPAAHHKVAQLAPHLPDGCVLVSVIRGDQVLIPRGDTVLLPGDSVMALAHTGAEESLRRALVGRA